MVGKVTRGCDRRGFTELTTSLAGLALGVHPLRAGDGGCVGVGAGVVSWADGATRLAVQVLGPSSGTRNRRKCLRRTFVAERALEASVR